ncbi:PKD domain-containing protein [Actinospica durhamensis]|uniref:PKD domain-containing protein n=1 Tax=Actinospica durhamensis TaxID=1508375 RepID=A0A941ETJ2_9ACTN|nr:PKD domain-containing protein [Actinospica durhamensis]MBR7833599.1 PKD domain-containing protein [Actinospica durhamensis]
MRKRNVAVTTALLVSVGSLAPTAAHAAAATTIYVNNANGANCSDSAAGAGTAAAPYCTVQAAVNVAGAGQTVLVEPGTYNENVSITHGGSAGSPLVVESAQSQQAQVGYATGSIVVAAATAPAFTVSGTSYVTVSGFATNGMSGLAAKVDGSSNVTVNGLLVNDWTTGLGNDAPVIQVTGGSSAVTVSRNTVNANSYPALIQVDSGSTGNFVTTNALNGYSEGVVVDGSTGNAVTSNTIEDICDEGVALTGASTGSTIENNIVQSLSDDTSGNCAKTTATAAGINVDSAATTGTKLDYNIVYVYENPYDWAGTTYQQASDLDNAVSQGAHDINDDPQAYTVPYGASPAIDSADASAPGELSTDLLGNTRADDTQVANTGAGTPTYYDRGAYELEDPLAPVVGLDTESGTVPSVITASESGADTGWAPVTSWSIDFGDGSATAKQTTSTPEKISHTYTEAGEYTVSLTATDGYGADGRGSTTTTEKVWILNSSVFHPVTQARILDTRKGTGTGGVVAPVKMNAGVALKVEGVDSIPATGVKAVALNLTVAGPTGNGYVEAYADGSTRPTTSNMNYTKGENLATQVIAPVGTDGKIDLYNGMTGGATDLIADVVGYYGPGAGYGAGVFGGPTRLLDTRHGVGTGTNGKAVPVPAGGTLKLTPDNAEQFFGPNETAVFNVTVVDEKSNGFLTVYPDGATRPGTSNINFRTGQAIANEVFAQTGSDGTIDFYNAGTGTIDLIADILGDYDTEAQSGYVPISPVRVIDTRSGKGAPKGAVKAFGTISNTLTGLAGVPTTTPTNVDGWAATATVVSPTANGDLEVYPGYSDNAPGVSTLNFTAGATVANSTMMGNEEGLKIYNQSPGTSQILLDVSGYFSAS